MDGLLHPEPCAEEGGLDVQRITGYSLHHLTTDAKQTFLRHARARLRLSGRLIIYDIFRQPGESPGAYHDRYLGWIRSRWTRMFDRECDLIDPHIRGYDLPETVADFIDMAQAAGFECKHTAAVDPAGDHVVIGLQ